MSTPNKKPTKVDVTVFLPRVLKQRYKAACAARDTTMTEDLLEHIENRANALPGGRLTAEHHTVARMGPLG